MAMFLALPLLAVPVLLYNLVLLTMKGGVQTLDAPGQLANPLFTIQMTSGGPWPVSLGDLFLAASLIVLFVELLKSTNSRNVAIINHSLSMILFVACLVEFLLLRGFATSVFFLITLMVLLDVLAGFIVTIVAARRDIDLHP
jgi:hypothetical protein